MRSILLYFSERFPLPLVILLAFSYSVLIIGISARLSDVSITLSLLVLVALSFIGFLLRLRVTDEFKDAKHDAKQYPNRPFQRGVISAQKLRLIGCGAVVLELGALALISPFALVAYTPVLIYSLLTAKEFFVQSWLNRHFTLYFVSHQLIFVTFFAWALLVFSIPINLTVVLAGLAFILAMSLFEIIRKLEYRRNKKGTIVQDSYPAVWGEATTIALIITLSIAVGVLLALVADNLVHLLIALGSVLFTAAPHFTRIRIAIALSLLAQGMVLVL
jgi:hypothetical protein